MPATVGDIIAFLENLRQTNNSLPFYFFLTFYRKYAIVLINNLATD